MKCKECDEETDKLVEYENGGQYGKKMCAECKEHFQNEDNYNAAMEADSSEY